MGPWGILIDLGIKLGGIIFEAATASDERKKQLAAEADAECKKADERVDALHLEVEERNKINLERARISDRLFRAGLSKIPAPPAGGPPYLTAAEILAFGKSRPDLSTDADAPTEPADDSDTESEKP